MLNWYSFPRTNKVQGGNWEHVILCIYRKCVISSRSWIVAALLVSILNLLSRIDPKKCPKIIVTAVTNNASTVNKITSAQFLTGGWWELTRPSLWAILFLSACRALLCFLFSSQIFSPNIKNQTYLPLFLSFFLPLLLRAIPSKNYRFPWVPLSCLKINFSLPFSTK